MPTLILAKHAMPQVQSDVPALRWHLGAEGVAGARRLGERLRTYAPSEIVSSREPKALETAAIVAEVLGLSHEAADGLHEHERPAPALLGRRARNGHLPVRRSPRGRERLRALGAAGAPLVPGVRDARLGADRDRALSVARR